MAFRSRILICFQKPQVLLKKTDNDEDGGDNDSDDDDDVDDDDDSTHRDDILVVGGEGDTVDAVLVAGELGHTGLVLEQ